MFTEVSGIITGIAFHEGEYGKNINLTIEDDGEKPVVLSVQTGSNYGEDLMKKIPAIDLSMPVRLAPYSFEDDKGKARKGITVYQGETKLKNFFQEGEGKESKMLHGFPEIPAGHGKKPVSKDEWKMYFLNCRIFLMDYIEKNIAIAKQSVETQEDWSPDAKKDNF